MFLMENTQMNRLFPESSHPTSDKWPHARQQKFSKLTIMVKKKKQRLKLYFHIAEEKKETDMEGMQEARPFGKKYLKRNLFGSTGYDNISIVRSGREIDAGNYGFMGDISDTYGIDGGLLKYILNLSSILLLVSIIKNNRPQKLNF